MSVTRSIAALFAIIAASYGYASARGSDDGPPPGLAHADAALATILRDHERAAGTTSGSAPTSEAWSFTIAGLHGTERLDRSGTDYRSHTVTDAYTEDYGQFDGVRWHRDRNGFTSTTTAKEDTSFLPLTALDDLRDPKNDVSLEGQTTADKPDYVLRVQRAHYKHPEWVFVEKASSHIVRIEHFDGKRRITYAYDDYRTTAGLSEPWHVHFTDGRADLDGDYVRTAKTVDASLSPAIYAPPPSTPTLTVGYGQGTPFTARVIRGMVIVRLSMGGRGYDFLLDAASPDSVIDRGVAGALQLPTFGQVTRGSDGTLYAYDTKIAEATAGPLRLHDFALTAETYGYDLMWGTKVVGVLGYDFLANIVLRIDYVNSAADLVPRDQFTGNDPVPGAMSVPLTIDDGTPLVPVGIGSGVAQRTVLNNALPYSLVFANYFEPHSTDFKDDPGEHRTTAIVPFADDASFGRTLNVWRTHASHMVFGPSDYQNYPIVATNFSSSDDEDAIDAMIGLDYLSYFDLYYDYANKRMFIKPNAWFFKTFHANT